MKDDISTVTDEVVKSGLITPKRLVIAADTTAVIVGGVFLVKKFKARKDDATPEEIVQEARERIAQKRQAQ